MIENAHPKAVCMPIGVAMCELAILFEAALARARHVIVLVLVLCCFPHCAQLCIGSCTAAVAVHCVSGQEALRCPDQELPAVLAVPAGEPKYAIREKR